MGNPNKRFLSPATTALLIMESHKRFHRDKVEVRGNEDGLLATKNTAWLKFKFENLDVFCAAINRNNSVPILTNRLVSL